MMADRFLRFVLLALLVLLAFYVAEPYVTGFLYQTSTPRTVTPRGNLSDIERSNIALFEAAAPSVVQVIGRDRTGVKSGSGFIWDAAGHVVTNNHVVDGVSTVAVQFSGGDSVSATILGRSVNYDLAVLRLGNVSRLAPPLPIGTSGDLRVGQFAYAIGNPFGLDESLTTGVISALKRRLPESGGREISDVIQTDAAVNPGNSGGPLLDSAGRVIGVNTAIYSPSGANAGIGFAIPIDLINRIVPQLISKGRVPTPGIGIMAADASVTTMPPVTGLIIAQIVPGSPAEQAGLVGINTSDETIGDVVDEVDGKPVRDVSDLTDELAKVGVGGTVHLKVLRNGQTRNVDVKVVDIGHG
jgi:2-alkenal reductase